MARLLVVDDEANMRRVLASILAADGHEVVEADGVRAAQRAFAESPFDLVLTDQRMADGDGLALLASCREVDPTVPVVVMTAYATVELAVEAMKIGAFDFVPKPFQPDAVRAVVRRACERTELVRENERLRGQVRRLAQPAGLLGGSSAMRAVHDLVARVAPTNATVLVQGETGTGKELVARAIHDASPRAARPFVAVNCAGFAETLLESELFGHERGAFTGADRARQGVFEAAHTGALFLDEAGEMGLPLQAKLLRVLTNGEVVRVGATAPRRVDVRIVAATNRDLNAMVAAGTFREDLYYRLAVFPIAVPPLRERREDVPLLAAHFLALAGRELNTPARSLSAGAIARLAAYGYPGNVRELRNLIERATILARGAVIEADDLPLGPAPEPEAAEEALFRGLPESVELGPTLHLIERRLVQRALASAHGVQAEAARRLGISRSLLAYKLKALGIAPEAPAAEVSVKKS
ncbi:MAG TPA: sigma-54 dependent transcriptional regulator [Thermoanaerobaculia bacterium]|nr:sigma-54 dependent transcriptional regulator [Thermoanaerobaculia bacterium]